MGAKNHGVIMPDANKESTLNALVGAAFGAAGQRCMALSTAVLVGEANEWVTEIAERAAKLRVSAGHEASSDVPPVISPEAKARINSLITSAEKEGVERGGGKRPTFLLFPAERGKTTQQFVGKTIH